MAPIAALLFCYRLPTLTPAEFKTYIEETHVSLANSLLGPHRPHSHTRHYTNKDSNFVMGTPSPTDPDLVVVITFESEEALQQSLRVRNSDDVREKFEEDEGKFMDRSKVKVVVLGEGDVRGGLNV